MNAEVSRDEYLYKLYNYDNSDMTGTWTINVGKNYGSNTVSRSDWACSLVLIYNRVLSKSEILDVEAWVDNLSWVSRPQPGWLHACTPALGLGSLWRPLAPTAWQWSL